MIYIFMQFACIELFKTNQPFNKTKTFYFTRIVVLVQSNLTTSPC